MGICRKYILSAMLLVWGLVFTISYVKTTLAENNEMRVTSTGIKDGYWERKYGKFGKDIINGIPALSVPFAIHNPPEKTISYAVVLKDNDAFAVAGYPWIHWLIANLNYENVAENESRSTNAFLQGRNSWGDNYYGGMAPPNAPHRYDLHVYALDVELPLEEGFTEDDLYKAMEGHVLHEYTLSGMYNN